MATVPQSLGELFLSFGLVSVPVNLYSATDASEKIAFNWIHRGCGSRVEQRTFCKKEDIELERHELVKGREVGKGEYVLFDSGELAMLEEQGTHTSDIVSFVPANAVDPLYFSKAYYLAPAKHGARPYKLLVEALRKTGRVAIARWVSHGKSYTVEIRPNADGILVLQQLHYPDEVRSLHVEDAEVRAEELDLAVALIEQSAVDEFWPEQYHNDFKERIEAAVQQKVEGKEITVPEEGPSRGTPLIDLMEVLRQSLTEKPAKRSNIEK